MDKTKQVIRLLEKLEKIMPENLWIFAANGVLCLMEKGGDGERITLDHGGFDPDCVIQSFDIESDGGDW